jgi:hypothetical protein
VSPPSIDQVLPGARTSLRAIGITAVALLVAAYVGGRCAGAASVNTSTLEAQVKQGKDSIKVLERDRALYIGEAAAARVQATEAHEQTRTALAHADSIAARAETLATAAERHRTNRIRIVDSTHVQVNVADSAHETPIVAIPPEIVEQLELDSAALEAKDLALDAKSDALATVQRELDAKTLENTKLWQAVTADSAEIRKDHEVIAELTQLKAPPKCGAKCGAAITVATLALLELAAHAIQSLIGAHP